MKLKFLLILLLLSSCAPSIRKNFSKYQKQFISKSNFLPSEEVLQGKNPKIVVFALDENGNAVASQSQLGVSIAADIENILSKNRLAQLVDRNAASKLKNEIALSEMNSTGSYKGPQVADFAISGTISNAGFNSKYSSAKVYFDPRSKSLISIPPKFTYNSDVAGNIKVYELPSLTVMESIEFSGNEVRSENVQRKGGVSLGGLSIGGEDQKPMERDDSLVRRAGTDAIDNVKVNIMNALAKRGYILEKRIYGKKTIFKISIGLNDGVKHGDKLDILGQYEVENAITNKSEIETRIITDGVVTDILDPKTCWIVVNDEASINSIRLGDAVKMKYKRNAFSGFMKKLDKMIK